MFSTFLLKDSVNSGNVLIFNGLGRMPYDVETGQSVYGLEITSFSTIVFHPPDGSGKPLDLISLSGEQRRQLIDTQQAYDAWRVANADSNHRFAGSMRWAERNGKEYLLRKIGKTETSLGLRNDETEVAYDAFLRGRSENTERRAGLSERLDQLAPVNVAMGLGRMPSIAARILRACDERGLLGAQLTVVGTNAMFAYEVEAGVQVESGLIATADLDLLYDARQHISLAVTGIAPEGLIGLLKKVDQSFAPVRPRGFRAVNRDGYLVDLIRPEAKDVFRDHLPVAISDLPEDLQGTAIFGLGWLINSPKLDSVALDERGYPVRIVAIDPRAFALHKAWLSRRQEREPVKAVRDLDQAKAAATIAIRYLRKSFDSPDLSALPNTLKELAPQLIDADPPQATKPNW
jgi:hypothetical protein